MKRKYLKSLIVGILLVLFVSNKIMRPKSNEFPEVRLKEIVNKDKSFAIMIQSKNGYKEYDSDTWPGSSYKFKEAKCIDNNGDEIKEAVTYEEGKITLTTNKTIYCTVYFDYKGTINILRENDMQKYLSEDLQGDKYRYQASFPECDNESECENAAKMTNWICFGTTSNCGTNEDNVDKYMYRIIGVTEEGQLYLIKETFLKEGTQKKFAWNDKYYVDSSNPYYCENGKCPEWNTSLLFKRINGTSDGNASGSGGYPDYKGDTNIFVDSNEYGYMAQGTGWYSLIADHEWMYGDVITTAEYHGDTMYAIEHGDKETTHYIGTEGNITQETYTWSQNVNAKISLMYLHDYYYSYYDGISDETRGNARTQEKQKESWLFFQKDGYNSSASYEWLSTRWGIDGAMGPFVRAWIVSGDDGWINDRLYDVGGARPVFYLNSSAKIANGKGTKESPFILEI